MPYSLHNESGKGFFGWGLRLLIGKTHGKHSARDSRCGRLYRAAKSRRAGGRKPPEFFAFAQVAADQMFRRLGPTTMRGYKVRRLLKLRSNPMNRVTASVN